MGGARNCRFGCIIPCKIFTEISQRLARSHRDWWDLAEIAEISPGSCHDVCWILNLGKISSISPRLPRLPRFVKSSPWCLWVFESRWDRWDLAMIFVGFSNLVEFVARFSTSRRDWRDLTVKFDSFCILPRFWKTQTSYRDCQNITQLFPDGMNNFPPWIQLFCGWPLAFCFSVRFQMG